MDEKGVTKKDLIGYAALKRIVRLQAVLVKEEVLRADGEKNALSLVRRDAVAALQLNAMSADIDD
jgi:hypothetical protein